MTKRETNVVAAVLSSPENESLSAEEVADRAISALDEVRALTHRLAVVGQISQTGTFGPQDRHTVVLGPFSARGILDDREKFERAASGGSAALTAGLGLAFDGRKGAGRFQLAPAFMRPRQAWDFYRDHGLPEEPDGLEELISRAQSQNILGPTCVCGIGNGRLCRHCGETIPGYCHRHRKGTPHTCAPRAA